MKNIRIASRASKLALAQVDLIRKLLENLSPGLETSIVKISTKGDRDKSDFLYKSESIGFFTSEVEKALLDGRADLAVHSLKDLPTALTPGLIVAAIPKRESPEDALIVRDKVTSIKDLPPGTTIGTSSLRRIAQLYLLRDDIKCVPLRGNVETRVRKVMEASVDAIVIACAGLNRLGLNDKISLILPPKDFIPAPAQGALAVQIRADDSELADLVGQIDDKNSRIAAETERAVLETMHGGCSIPLGVYSQIQNDEITIDAIISDLEGKKHVRRTITSPLDQAMTTAKKLAGGLLADGGREILDKIRNSR
ncbi:MAG: hydroxymethylbilane synthase [Planctomycetota bacterium]|jgi:hydroxymethylbilane synthase